MNAQMKGKRKCARVPFYHTWLLRDEAVAHRQVPEIIASFHFEGMNQTAEKMLIFLIAFLASLGGCSLSISNSLHPFRSALCFYCRFYGLIFLFFFPFYL